MITKFVEVTNGPQNWGKFLVARFEPDEYTRHSVVDEGRPLLRATGHHVGEALVMDLQTCEGAFFRVGGHAGADLAKHRIWVCPMYEPFLEWLYAFTKARTGWFDDLPAHVDLPEAPFAMHGYRREGR